jgi:hypothetical protein
MSFLLLFDFILTQAAENSPSSIQNQGIKSENVKYNSISNSNSTPNSKSKYTLPSQNESDSTQKEFSLKEFTNQANENVKLDLSWTNDEMFQNKGEFSNVQVKLETKPLWDKFASIGTEMIITKCGRFVDLKLSECLIVYF